MSFRLTSIPVALFVLLGALPAPLSAQDASARDASEEAMPVSAEEDARLREWLRRAESRADSTRTLVASGYVVAGTLASALGTTSLAAPELTETPLLSPAVSTYMLSSGLLFIGSGIATILTADRALPVAWTDARLTTRDVRQLEERLASAADQALDARIVTGALGGGITLGGIATLSVLGVSGVDPTAQPLDYALSAVFSLGGVLSLVLSLFDSPAEVDYAAFRRGDAPAPATAVSFRPTGTGFVLTF